VLAQLKALALSEILAFTNTDYYITLAALEIVVCCAVIVRVAPRKAPTFYVLVRLLPIVVVLIVVIREEVHH